jgi:signal transduction histidine kinase
MLSRDDRRRQSQFSPAGPPGERQATAGDDWQELRRVLERAAHEWRSTFDAIRSPVLLVGLDGRVHRLNRSARELLRRDYREILGRPVEEIGSGQPWTAVAALAHRVRKSFTPEACEVTDESCETTWEVEAVVSAASAEADSRVIVQARDITKTVRLQESLRRSETMAALGAVVGGVAHEVRNPLFGMSAVLDAFESRFGDLPEHRPYLPRLRSEIGRMTELMQALLDYGKPARLEMAPCEISQAVEDALALSRPLAERQGVSLSIHREAAGRQLLLDVSQMTQAFKNVAENAIQHSPRGGEVKIREVPFTAEDSPWIRVSVRDQGPGFPPEDLPRVLEPFFSRRDGGTGLGLSIVSRAVEGHGGHVRIANHPAGGAVVDLEFPCIRPEEAC